MFVKNIVFSHNLQYVLFFFANLFSTLKRLDKKKIFSP